MAYIYLLNLYKTIDQRLNKAKKNIETAEDNSNDIRHLEGRIHALAEFKEFLTENLNRKLPRKIRKHLKIS